MQAAYRIASHGFFTALVLLIGLTLTGRPTNAQTPSAGPQIADAVPGAAAEHAADAAPRLRYRGMPELSAPLPALHYPEEAVRQGIEGRVLVAYTVDEYALVREATVVHGLGYGCDEEALRIIQQARFKPILDAEGRPTARRFLTPIAFRLR